MPPHPHAPRPPRPRPALLRWLRAPHALDPALRPHGREADLRPPRPERHRRLLHPPPQRRPHPLHGHPRGRGRGAPRAVRGRTGGAGVQVRPQFEALGAGVQGGVRVSRSGGGGGRASGWDVNGRNATRVAMQGCRAFSPLRVRPVRCSCAAKAVVLIRGAVRPGSGGKVVGARSGNALCSRDGKDPA
ncbi:hypothetical protein DFJ74DRAFT_667650 [Hyaloraphidium curvatum]|nr:hypothetical protein DFJ74DRAFT_667650 [Hyaloraphidium curvatum]